MSERVAIIHDWLNGMRGGEKVLEIICELFPRATVFTLFHEPDRLSPLLRDMETRASFLNRWAFARARYRYLLPLLPWLVERFDLRDFDLVISSSHCVAKGARTPAGVPHLCYCHSPMRYVWDLHDQYFGPGRAGRLTRIAARACRRPLQRWDARSAARVTRFVANSRNIAGKIERFYGRPADVVHPPVNREFFTPGEAPPGDFYFVCSAMVPYKRLELAIEACAGLGRRLLIAGEGGERARLEALARRLPGGDGIEFLGRVDDERLRALYRRCRAFVFPGEEDFGITPLEAMSCGRPVVALARGGALETVVDGETGVFFGEPTADALADALARLEGMAFDPVRLRRHTEAFSRERFREGIAAAVERVRADVAPASATR